MATAPTGTPAAPIAAEHPLRNRYFRLLWMGNSVSWFGDQFYVVALPWLVLQLSGSAVALGTVMMSAAIPRAALMLIGGVASDRFSARRIMIATAWARTLLVAAVAALLWTSSLRLWHLYLLAFWFGAADAFYAPASQTLLPTLLKPEQLPAANSVSQSTLQVTTLVGPAPAAFVVKALGTAWAFFFDAVSFLVIIAALWTLPDVPVAPANKQRKSVLGSIKDGLRHVSSDPALRSLLVIAAMVNFCTAGPMSIGLAWIAKHQFGTPLAFAAMTSAVAAGTLVGMVLAGVRRNARRGRLFVIVSSMIGASVFTIGLVHRLWVIAALLFAMASCAGLLNIQLVSWIQQRVDRAVLGRVMSVLMFAAIGLMPVSLAVAGIVIKWSVTGLFAAAGTLILVVTAMAMLQGKVATID